MRHRLNRHPLVSAALVTSIAGLAGGPAVALAAGAAEAAGELELINPGAADPYQVRTTTVLVRPVLPER